MSTLHADVLVVQGSDVGAHGLGHTASMITLLPEFYALIGSTSQTHTRLFTAGVIITRRFSSPQDL